MCIWLCRYLWRGTLPSSTPLYIRWHISSLFIRWHISPAIHTWPPVGIFQEFDENASCCQTELNWQKSLSASCLCQEGSEGCAGCLSYVYLILSYKVINIHPTNLQFVLIKMYFLWQARSHGRSCGGSSLSWHIIPVLLISILVNIPTFFSSQVSPLLAYIVLLKYYLAVYISKWT